MGLQEKEIAKHKRALVETMKTTREAADSRDAAQREVQVLQAALQREVADFEVVFKQRVAVRGSCGGGGDGGVGNASYNVSPCMSPARSRGPLQVQVQLQLQPLRKRNPVRAVTGWMVAPGLLVWCSAAAAAIVRPWVLCACALLSRGPLVPRLVSACPHVVCVSVCAGPDV